MGWLRRVRLLVCAGAEQCEPGFGRALHSESAAIPGAARRGRRRPRAPLRARKDAGWNAVGRARYGARRCRRVLSNLALRSPLKPRAGCAAVVIGARGSVSPLIWLQISYIIIDSLASPCAEGEAVGDAR